MFDRNPVFIFTTHFPSTPISKKSVCFQLTYEAHEKLTLRFKSVSEILLVFDRITL